MSRRSAPWAAVVLGAGLAVAAGLQPGAAFATGDSTSWVAYGPPQPGSTVQVVQGTADGQGGCVLDLAAALSPSETAARVDEVAFNETTCQSRVAITRGGAVAPDPPDPSGASSSSSGPVAPASSTAPPPRPAAPSVTSAGYYKSWYEDPVGIVVNSVMDSTKWRWNRVCATGIYGSWRYTWHSSTGWSLGANNAQNYYTCNRTTVSSYAHFHNRPFCAFIATDTYYNRNNVHGRYDGYLLGDVNARKTGPCSHLLSFHASLRRTQN